MSINALSPPRVLVVADDLGRREVRSVCNVRDKRETGECRPRFSERHVDEPKAEINVGT
jgi:hypothetical protein